MINKLLVANRGEIACRIFRAARELGISTVAVYSEADRDAMHPKFADESVEIGPPEAKDSYLNIDRIIDAAKKAGADAIHPGYGFLSERAEFAERVIAEGLVFVGPPAVAMRRLGAKIDAKRLAVEQNVPVTPGYFEPGATTDKLKKEAKKIGYPVMLKASAGGGGRGMRVVREEGDFERECRLASEEAEKAFGDGAMMVEKLIERPRHIEVQVLADHHGNVACLYERECSIQRRHQKVIEEAPSPYMTDELWQKMRKAAMKLVLASGYQNAGTIEFMVDSASGEFYFLEVNARLQVEHPVTEMVTGIDLVQWQLKIASGEELNLPEPVLKGDRSALRGHAIEARIISEDPAKGFLPSVGEIVAWAEPLDPTARVDTGFGQGGEVTRFYDSLLAKLIVFGEDRSAAVRKMQCALEDFHVLGVKTNIEYVLAVVSSEGFAKGDIDTGYLGREFADWQPGDDVPKELADILRSAKTQGDARDYADVPTSPAWDAADGFRVAR
ncbi:MAG TPA: biotin carboxylase N-terminal domain-containing protein [Fimbriimonadaceae bacterium]|nr:biotin carboxylase N-terminal domain-containing protein [Fimbriimonadaceae bacterium]